MGNANANSKQRIERPYSIDGYDPSVDRRESPRPGEFGSGYNDLNRPTESSRRPVLCYQSSSDYGNEDTSEDFKVICINKSYNLIISTLLIDFRIMPMILAVE